MPLWMGTQRQKEFWIEIGEWLERVDDAREDLRGLPGMDMGMDYGSALGMSMSPSLPSKVTVGGGLVEAERIRI